jgi:hypothetical protein
LEAVVAMSRSTRIWLAVGGVLLLAVLVLVVVYGGGSGPGTGGGY